MIDNNENVAVKRGSLTSRALTAAFTVSGSTEFTGSVLVDNSLDPKLFLEESEFARIRDVVRRIATNDYSNSSQLSGRAVVKKGVVKKFYLDGLNTILFEEADQIIFAKLQFPECPLFRRRH